MQALAARQNDGAARINARLIVEPSLLSEPLLLESDNYDIHIFRQQDRVSETSGGESDSDTSKVSGRAQPSKMVECMVIEWAMVPMC